MKILITGGAGFIGSALVRHLIANTDDTVINLDILTYAANLHALRTVEAHPRYAFEQVDICNADEVRRVLATHQPQAIMHLAAESHVDRSIAGPQHFIQANIVGTFVLLQEALTYWQGLDFDGKARFRFHHVSTDEVFGSLDDEDGLFTETTPYAPSSPYSASKASADHLVRAWHRTYGLPVLVTNCSNNYGPFQHHEKLIPRMITNALAGKPLTLYGDGTQVRDWLYVDDHVRALYTVLTQGHVGATYNIGGNMPKQNKEVVLSICEELAENARRENKKSFNYQGLITHTADRPGHDTRYAIDASKIQQLLGWSPQENFDTGLRKTIAWYLNAQDAT